MKRNQVSRRLMNSRQLPVMNFDKPSCEHMFNSVSGQRLVSVCALRVLAALVSL
jgi:hypothetical protein